MEMQNTTKGRLREEFATGYLQREIAERLTAEGLGRKRRDGAIVKWDQSALSVAFRSMGLRRNKSPNATRDEPAKAGSRKTTRGGVRATKTDRIEAVSQILRVSSIDPEERIAMALMLIGD